MIPTTQDWVKEQARDLMRGEWFPTAVVAKAISHWIFQAETEGNIDRLKLAYRWCKWQELKAPGRSEMQANFVRCYSILKQKGLLKSLRHSLFTIAPEELSPLKQDVEAMTDFFAEFDMNAGSPRKTLSKIKSESRGLWGEYYTASTSDQTHFARLAKYRSQTVF